MTDGTNESIALKNGRLWKRDRRSASILLFSDDQVSIKISAKGQMPVRKVASQYYDHGFYFAAQGVATLDARQPGHGPVVAPTGNLITVIDVKHVAAAFAAAA